jgi:hypothetical protein
VIPVNENGRTLDDDDLLGRLEGIQQHLQDLEEIGYSFLHLPNVFEHDPIAKPPYVVSDSFIPESVGGNIRVVHRNSEEDIHDSLATENLEQMLGSYLPGGYKRRWRNFNLWQGRWEPVRDRSGRADIAPMFEFDERLPLSDLLGTEQEDYTGYELPTEDVTVYLPRVMYVQQLPYDTRYCWHVGIQNILANKNPMERTLELGRSDPTTNYLWFRHYRSEPEAERTPVEDSRIVEGYRFEPETEFLRCYYASLLTMYEKENNDTISRTLSYEHSRDDQRAFVGALEESQLLLLDIDRARVRSQAARVFSEHPDIKRDTEFALLYREAWEQLFFQDSILEHVFAVEPFVNHLIAADYWAREHPDYEVDSVFELDIDELSDVLATLLSPEAERLTLMGYDAADCSRVLEVIRNHRETVAELLAECREREVLLDFAEEVLIHSIEHALSTWATEATPAGGSFELWYDVNFQQRDDDIARAGVYDSIQGGAGIATEVYDYLEATANLDLDAGLAAQGACHTGTADRTVLELLSGANGDVLYDLYEDRSSDESGGFRRRLLDAQETVVGDQAEAYNLEDLTSQAEKRVNTLFETRETARFYAYVADRYEDVAETVERTPRAVDLLLHLDRELIHDPRVKQTYQRFARGTNRRDLSELGERLEEVTVQCVTACPDCLETGGTNCVHGGTYQSKLLSRKLLSEVCGY